MTNGNKAAQQRERKAKEAKNAGGTSQLKSNLAAKTLICKNCKQDWQSTTTKKVLEQHVESKHPKLKFDDCFPA